MVLRAPGLLGLAAEGSQPRQRLPYRWCSQQCFSFRSRSPRKGLRRPRGHNFCHDVNECSPPLPHLLRIAFRVLLSPAARPKGRRIGRQDHPELPGRQSMRLLHLKVLRAHALRQRPAISLQHVSRGQFACFEGHGYVRGQRGRLREIRPVIEPLAVEAARGDFYTRCAGQEDEVTEACGLPFSRFVSFVRGEGGNHRHEPALDAKEQILFSVVHVFR
mmetsp:Transcript_64005/g.139168  ORF Transcript_64005/g.139168 Transcript_64005/m.139168 type:complete len:218 (+) Transcript_64005:252-905(+)